MPTEATNPRDEYPDWAERSGRMAALIAAPALPYYDVGLVLNIPLSTLDKLRAQGKGPKCFRIGRRLYVRQKDFLAWLDQLATAEAA